MTSRLLDSRFLNRVFPFALVIACVITIKLAYYVSFLILSTLTLIIYIWRKYDSRIILSVALFLAAVTGFLFLIGDMYKVNEVGRYAYHLFVLGIISWVVCYARGKVEIKGMSFARLKYFLPYLLVVFFAALVGDYLGIWVGSPVGDDAFVHIGKVNFILDHFPNVNWYPYWFLGFDIFRVYPSTCYFLLAVTHVLTGISVSCLMVVFFFSSMVLLGSGIYGFSRLLRLPWYTSVGLAVMLLSFPLSWAWTVTGGAYPRSFALPFYVFSVLTVYYHTLQINSEKNARKIFFIVTFVLAFTVLLHLMIGFFAFITAILIYSLAVRGIRRKIKTLLKVFIPVCGLVSWNYLPILEHFIINKGGMTHEIFYESYECLFTMYNPVLIPLVLTSAVAFCLAMKKYKPTISQEKISVVLVSLILSVYFFLFGWTSMPESLYLMAAYDYRNWFGYSLLIFLIGILSLLYDFFRSYPPKLKSLSFKRCGRVFNKILVVALIVVVPLAFVTSLPILDVMNINPDDPQSFIYYLRKDVDQIVTELPENFRLAFATRRIYAFHYYEFPNLEATAGRQTGKLHPYYHSIFSERVFCRYPGEYEKYYFEEQPHICSKAPYIESNFFSSMFWLDWFGAGGVVIAPWEARTNTSYEYTLRPQLFGILKFGETIYAQYREASPILMCTNASTLGVVVSEKYGEEVYSEVLLTLGELNLNSQWVIPLKLKIAHLDKNLRHIDNLLVTPALYQEHRTSLEEYARSGGHLIIMDYRYNGDEIKLVELTSPRLHFYTYAMPLSECPLNSEVLAKTAEGPVAYRLNVGKGSITRSTVSIKELYETATPTASLYLAKVLIPNLPLTEVPPIPDTWYIEYREGVVEASISQTRSGEVTLGYKSNITLPYNQVNFATLLEEETSTSAMGVIQFELWNDGKVQIIEISQASTKSQAHLHYTLSNSAWKGWKTFSIPLASFIKKPDVDLLGSFDGIVITAADISPYSEGNHTLKVSNLNFYKFEQNHSYMPLEGRWVQPNRFEISTNDGTTNLLWKETYVSDWRIETIPSSDVEYYYAGPGVIFVHFPLDVEKITFVKPLSKSQLAGMVISLSTFLSLIFLVIYKKKFC